MNKTILITGISSGIGRATALYFKDKGWNVIGTMRQEDQDIELSEKGIKTVLMDVNSDESVASGVRDALGIAEKIDVVVNNAGYALLGKLNDLTLEQISDQLNTNTMGTVRVCKALIPHFIENNSGVIINISSIAGLLAYPYASPYNMSKYAVEGFSESLQYELKPHKIKVKLIEPGLIRTRFYSDSLKLPESDANLNSIAKSLNNKVNHQKLSSDPIVVAKMIYKAANSPTFRLRYKVGRGRALHTLSALLIPKEIIYFFFRLFIKK